MDAPDGETLWREIEAKLDGRIRPVLQVHGGDLTLLTVADGVVGVRFEGACVGCPLRPVTMAVTIVMIIGWRRRERWWPLWACAHLHRVINEALKRCGHRWNVGHWVASSAPYRVSIRVRAATNKSTKITIMITNTRRFCCRTSSRRTPYPLLQRWNLIKRHEQKC